MPIAIPAAPRYSDFTAQFAIHPVSNDLGRVSGVEAIRRSLKNLILTDKYERLLDPKIGSNIRRSLFEPLDASTAQVIKDYVAETVGNYEPRVSLKQVEVIPEYDKNGYTISIVFNFIDNEDVGSVELFLTRAR